MPGHFSWEEITGTTFNDMIHLFASSGTSGTAPPLFQVGAFIHVSGLHAAQGLGCYAHSCRESVLHSISRFRERFSVLFFCISTLLSAKNCFITCSVAYSECNLIAGATDHCVVKWVVTFFTITFFISHSLSHRPVPSRTACCESLCSGWSAIKT